MKPAPYCAQVLLLVGRNVVIGFAGFFDSESDFPAPITEVGRTVTISARKRAFMCPYPTQSDVLDQGHALRAVYAVAVVLILVFVIGVINGNKSVAATPICERITTAEAHE